ncbi:VRR-NUC domain-containing protein [Chitinimonas sp. JJ19]|uniref:VRR-NUC domain-containing protein n=1 Tax=Chitinimonas sp. JJ19 TaxID=3109352 RepID=UPI002FFF36D3
MTTPLPSKSTCIAQMAPGVAALNVLANTGNLCPLLNELGITVPCPAPVIPDQAWYLIDRKVLCELMCCCADSPNTILKEGVLQNAYQSCVADTVAAARDTVKVGRYVPEVNHDMTLTPPKAILHSDGRPAVWGDNAHWKHSATTGLAKKYAEERAAAAAAGRARNPLVRRPDIIAVKNPNKPVSQDNIDRIYEMKFANDRAQPNQLEDYVKIAGNDKKVVRIDEEDCNCDDGKRKKQLVPAAAQRLADIKDRGYQHAAKVVPIAAGAAGAVVTGGASLSLPAAFGRVLGAAGL